MREETRMAVEGLLIEAKNIHREYLSGNGGGCPCTSSQFEACPLGSAIARLEEELPVIRPFNDPFFSVEEFTKRNS